MKVFAPVAALALFLVSAVALPVPEVVTIGTWTGAKEASVPSKRVAGPEPAYDLSAWSGPTHVSIEGRGYDISLWKGATKASVEGREA